MLFFYFLRGFELNDADVGFQMQDLTIWFFLALYRNGWINQQCQRKVQNCPQDAMPVVPQKVIQRIILPPELWMWSDQNGQ